MIAPNGTQSLVSYSMRNGYQAIEQTAPRFVSRDGAVVTAVITTAWRGSTPGIDAPHSADAKTTEAAARDRKQS
ncbi:hypothetical protein [Caulobacter sp. S45]|uniref:hypothetical protein n=1 Tax=Caulobacter sp. S45 TaxID=1641861 RepID=UPI00131D6D6A|nr:hypothetical protein [Caulobacter sp. S45]